MKPELKKGSLALYIQIKDYYRDLILRGELKRGDKVDSEMAIQEKFNVSRITARQAILDLEKEGMVKRGRGVGTYVIWQPGIEEELCHISSFTKEMEHINRIPGTSSFQISKEKIGSAIAQVLGMSEDDEMYCLRRVRTADDVKIVYFVSYFPLSTNLPLDASKFTESIYEMLSRSGVGTPVRVEEKIRAILPTEEIRKALSIMKTQPILARERVSFNEANELVEYTNCYYRGDLYTYSISTSEGEK